MLSEESRRLYAKYYSSSQDLSRKRSLSADQSAKWISCVLAGYVADKLVDVGAGNGSVLSNLQSKGVARELYALEISESAIDAIRSRCIPSLCDVRAFDGYRIPFPDKYFDVAIAVHVLEHVEHERLFLSEIRRVCRRLCVEVPLELGIRVRRSIALGRPFGHINFYTRHTFLNLLESTGFEVLKCSVVSPSIEYERQISGRTLGWIKSQVRKWALVMSPELAPWLTVYNCYAYCEAKRSW